MPHRGLGHLVNATRNSLSGLLTAWKGEQAFRHEGIVLVILAAVLAYTGKTPAEWLLVLGGWLFVMVVELLNSAIEKTCDLVTTEFRPLIKAAKDMASSAIFLAILINAGLWLHVFV